MSDEQNNTSGFLKGALGLLGLGLVGYTIYHVAKSYDEMVDNYNDMVDKYNKNIDFIDSCDFYTVKKDVDDKTKKEIQSNTFVEVKETVEKDGSVHKETYDATSGFSLHEFNKEREEEDNNNCDPSLFKLL